MKIPDSVRIGGVEYPIVYKENLNDGSRMLYGQISYDDCEICMSAENGTSHQFRCLTLWHEILHGLRNNNGMEIENEEAVVEMFAKGIYQVLQDNASRFFDIASDLNAT